ncbi:prepilin-type N-terminal cleavage/methylation domain-containing protein [Candidatus Parcubacteria bacterium]|nr:prepilin-type N-terminal cleavage/methylation domain-containing protein [Candidatus Parcubacteria bacterium]
MSRKPLRGFTPLEKHSPSVLAQYASFGITRSSSLTGFTLVEMLVVLTIISLITAIALFGQATFNRSVLLTDTAYTVALSLREMQSLGLSSRRFGAVLNPGYGGRFSAATSSNTSYVLFADTFKPPAPPPLSNCPTGTAGQPDAKPGNCIYDAGSDGIVQTYTFNRGLFVNQICGTPLAGGSDICSPTLTALDVTFVRSNTTDAILTGHQSSGSIALRNAKLYLRSPQGTETRGICISSIGHISVSYAACSL